MRRATHARLAISPFRDGLPRLLQCRECSRPSILRCSTPLKRRENSHNDFSRKQGHLSQAIWTESGISLFSLFRRSTAPVVRERLQVLLAHERIACGKTDLLAVLREEIVAVIARHVLFEPDKIQIKMDRGKSVSTLEVDIEIPSGLIGNVSAL